MIDGHGMEFLNELLLVYDGQRSKDMIVRTGVATRQETGYLF